MLIRYLFQALQGKFLWEQLKKQYDPGYHPSRYILFPSEDTTYNGWALCYMKSYLEKNRFDKVMAVVKDEALKKGLTNIRHNNLHIVQISPAQMTCLMRLCALIDLNRECTIVSVKEPYDTGAERLLGKKGTTKGDIIWYDVYKMSKPPKKPDQTHLAGWKRFSQYHSAIISDWTREKTE